MISWFPEFPGHGKPSEVMLLIIGIVGTTVAPWQLFFQQSCVIDTRIMPCFMRYERADLWIGIVLVIIGAVAMMAFAAAAFTDRPEFGNFQDAGAVAAGLTSMLVVRREGRKVRTDSFRQMIWRIPPLDQLPRARLTPLTWIWLAVLRGYVIVAGVAHRRTRHLCRLMSG